MHASPKSTYASKSGMRVIQTVKNQTKRIQAFECDTDKKKELEKEEVMIYTPAFAYCDR